MAPPLPVRSLREGTRAAALRQARTCYDHLAGKFGVDLLDALLGREILTERDGSYAVTDEGVTILHELGIDLQAVQAARRPLIRTCIDWSEQRPHLSDGLGCALATRFFELDWIRRVPSSRAVRVTEEGYSDLQKRFGLGGSFTI
jgi:hypothetical protein